MFTIHITTLILKDDASNIMIPASTSVVSFSTKAEAEIAIKQFEAFNDDNNIIAHFPIRLYKP